MKKTKKYRFCALFHEACGVARTKVLFREKGKIDGEIEAYWMDRDVYSAIPLLQDATVEDYEKIGKVDRALSIDIFSQR